MDSTPSNNLSKLTKSTIKSTNLTNVEIVSPYLSTTQEVLRTSNFTISKPNLCTGHGGDPEHGGNSGHRYDHGHNGLVIVVISAAGNFKERMAIRETWARAAKQNGSKVIFLLGVPQAGLNSDLQINVQNEDIVHGDIVQGSNIDSYKNLNLKSISMLQFVSKFCPNASHLLKVDDDVIINIRPFLSFVQSWNVSKTITGQLGEQSAPIRNKNSKWYLPVSIYNKKYFPNYITGAAYLMTGDSVAPLLAASLKLKPIFLEDVLITGMAADQANITRVHNSRMLHTRLSEKVLSQNKWFINHDRKPNDIRRIWQKYASKS